MKSKSIIELNPVEPHKKFYRVLYTNENKCFWENKYYHSGHLPPSDWYKIWKNSKGSLNVLDYPVECSTGYYSESARQIFLNAAKAGRIRALTDEEAKYICEQAGVFAYPTARQAFDYLSPESPARKNEWDRYVEFDGVELAKDSVEKYGAAIVYVKSTDGKMLTRSEFALVHQLNDQ